MPNRALKRLQHLLSCFPTHEQQCALVEEARAARTVIMQRKGGRGPRCEHLAKRAYPSERLEL